MRKVDLEEAAFKSRGNEDAFFPLSKIYQLLKLGIFTNL
jgi:hypothetical protein